MAVQLGSAEEVGQRVVDAWAVLRADGDVVLARDAVQLTKQAGERFAARRLAVDDVHVGHVVDVEEHGLTGQQRGVGGCAGNHRQQLAPRDLSVRVVEVSVFGGVAPAECCPYPEVLGPRRRVDCAAWRRRCGLEVEAEAGQAGVCGEDEWRGPRSAPLLSAVPEMKLLDPKAHIVPEGGADADGRGVSSGLAQLQGVQHAAHERTSPRQDLCGERELTDQGCGVASRDDSLAEEGAQQGSELLHALGSAGHGLRDRVQLDAEEGQLLGRSFRLVGVDDEAELTNDGLRQAQVAAHVCLAPGDEEEVVEVADVGDAVLGEGELHDGQQLRAHARRGAQAERHRRELVQLAFETKAEVLAH